MTKQKPASIELIHEHLRSKDFRTEAEMKAYLDILIKKSAEDILQIDNSPKLKAIYLIDCAKDQNSRKKYLKYINDALAADPDNADAYLMLAEEEDNEDKYLSLIDKAIEAGKRTIGDEFEALKGHFWMEARTRPYMRALSRKADQLRTSEKIEEAIEIYTLLIDLNPNDNQGIRDLLAPLLVFSNRFNEYKKLKTLFIDDESLSFYISDAFLSWIQAPKSKKTLVAFTEMFMRNSFLVNILFADDGGLPEISDVYIIGSPEEAVYSIYTSGLLFSIVDEQLNELMINVITACADKFEVMQENWNEYMKDDTKTKFYIQTAFAN